ncbi:MAG: DUF4328 domain-containing protein, partial [Mycobacteriaceae bacterium]
VAISDSMVITAGVLAPMVVLVTVVTCTLWLLRVREAAAARIDRREARSTHSIVLAIFVPVWNLLMPGVLLTELERDINTGLEQDTNGAASTGPSRLLRTWWVSWVLSVVLAAGVWLWRLRDTVQARADGVLLAALSDLVAAGAVLLTLLLVQRYSEALAGVSKRTSRRRWVASVPAGATGTI